MTNELRDMVVSKRPSTQVKEAACETMVTIREDGLRKARAGVTTLDEVLRVALGGLA
jgi:type II secretory ATPase GspE/PulE/Tfp pilus assembly ATPase PilB-like protein